MGVKLLIQGKRLKDEIKLLYIIYKALTSRESFTATTADRGGVGLGFGRFVGGRIGGGRCQRLRL